MHSIFVKLHRKTYRFNRNVSSLLENQCETPEKHRRGNVSTPTCDVTMHKMVVPYGSNVCENSLVQWNVWIHRLPRENISTMSPALVGRNFSSVDILLTFTLRQCNVMTILNNLSGTGPEAARCQLLLRVGQLRYLNVSARKLPSKLQCQEMINIT